MVYYTEAVRLDFLFDALSHRTRRDLIQSLTRSAKPVSISDFAGAKKLSLQNAGKHVRKLEQAKLVQRKKIGVENYLYLNQAALSEAQRWIEDNRQYWNQQFDAVESYLKRHPSSKASDWQVRESK